MMKELGNGSDKDSINNVDFEVVACCAEKLMEYTSRAYKFASDITQGTFRAELFSRCIMLNLKGLASSSSSRIKKRQLLV